jgi:drug/metabolite transporter (DMT)-like permease
MPIGVLFSLIAYGIYSCGDAIIKSFSGSLGVFEIGFFTAIASVIPAMIAKPAGEHWRHTYRMAHPWLLQLRALSGVCGTMLVIYGFTTIPLAEVYSLAFLTPVFVVILSVLVLKEQVSWQRWFFLMTSFAGVLLVVRPGFRELHLGHLAAVGCALFGSVNTTIYRTIASKEKRVSLVGVTATYAIIVNGLLMLPHFTMPNLHQLVMLAMVGLCGGTGHLFFIAATRNSPASQVAPAQYSQILWAIVLGAVFYKEFPDAIAITGLVVVVLAGVMNVISDDVRARFFRRLAMLPAPRPIPPEPETAQQSPPLPAT